MESADLIFFNCVRDKNPRVAPGLGNRLRGMFSVYAFAESLQIPFGFAWKPSGSCDCNFQDIFKVPVGVEHFDKLEDVATTDIHLHRHFDPHDKFYKAHIEGKCDLNWDDFHKSYIECIRRLQPVDGIIEDINKFDVTDKVGVHVRKTDHGKTKRRTFEYRHMNTDEWYFKMLDDELEKDSTTSFFLAVDNLESREIFLDRYGDSMVTFTSEDEFKSEEVRHTSMSDAVSDLWLLSRCKKIYGARCSSFCEFASDVGGVELIVPTKGVVT